MSMLTFSDCRRKLAIRLHRCVVTEYKSNVFFLVEVFRTVFLSNNNDNVVGTPRSIFETPVVDSRVKSPLTLLRIDNHTIVIDEYLT